MQRNKYIYTNNNTRKIKPKKKPTKMSLLPTLNDLANAESVCIICFGKSLSAVLVRNGFNVYSDSLSYTCEDCKE